MSIEILMPALSPTMTEGNLTKWFVQEGQVVKAGDVIAEIETDKATMEVEAVDEGTVEKLLYNYGCLYHTIGKLEDDISILFEAYDSTLEELGKENPNNELYILRSKHFKAKK